MPRFDPATPLVHPLPGPERAEVRPGLVYAEADGRELAMDLYLPSGPAPGSPVPAVLLVHGEANPAMLRGVRSWASTPAGAGCWPPRAWSGWWPSTGPSPRPASRPWSPRWRPP